MIHFKPVGYALLAALLYGISYPFSKILLDNISPALMAALLYLGAGMGMFLINLVNHFSKKQVIEANITKKDTLFVIAMIVLDVIAPILLMFGLTMTTSVSASLLNNFEIVATAIIALLIFKEAIGLRMWLSILLITFGCIILSVKEVGNFSFSLGSILVLLACVSWGFENNCTRMLSLKNPLQIVIIKGFGSGFSSLIVYYMIGVYKYSFIYIFYAIILGFFSYGISIYFYVKAQRELGAARTSAFYAAAPFMGAVASFVFLKEPITMSFSVAFIIMIIGAYFAISENHGHEHIHKQETHIHKHSHQDGHHDHFHTSEGCEGAHSHEHTHNEQIHSHSHLQDLHHIHKH